MLKQHPRRDPIVEMIFLPLPPLLFFIKDSPGPYLGSHALSMHLLGLEHSIETRDSTCLNEFTRSEVERRYLSS